MTTAKPISEKLAAPARHDAVAASGRQSLPVCDSEGRYAGMTRGGDTYMQEAISAADSPMALLRVFAESDTDSVALVDNNGVVVGVADRQQTLGMMSEATGAGAPGASIVVSMSSVNYEVGRIVNIIEQAGARVTSLLTTTSDDTTSLLIKIAQPDPYPVVEALERHGYDVGTFASGRPADADQDILRRNYDALMSYMGMGVRSRGNEKKAITL